VSEKWLPVLDWPGYEVSDHGRARSVDRVVRGAHGEPKRLKGKLLSLVLAGSSKPGGRYYACVLYRDGKRRQVAVHNLVLEVFVGPRPEGMWGLHRDDDPANNRLENLYWGTPTQNVRDSIKSGRHKTVAESAKTKCPQGHDYTEANTRRKPGTGHRGCVICHRREARESYHRNKNRRKGKMEEGKE
jgi:hypothetical protein